MAGTDYSTAPTKHISPANATSSTSKVRQGSTTKDLIKKAQEENKNKYVVKDSVYTTMATGDSPEEPKLSYTESVADYYRDGKIDETGNLLAYPRTIEPYEKEQPASIRIFGYDAKKANTGKDLIPRYTKFILESVQETHTERSQIVETFGDFYVFMFGERPPVYNFTGTLINTKNASWLTDFMYMYEQYLRGTRCVENNAVSIITYGGRQVEGLILNTSNQTSAPTEAGVPFQFSVVVFERRFFNFSEDMGYFSNTAGTLFRDKKFIEMLNKTAGITGKGTSNQKVSDAHNGTDNVVARGAPSMSPRAV